MKKNSSSPRTDAQAAASRANGAKSKGPITPEGKARSSQNNLKHGLRSSRVVLSNESLEKYHALLDAYVALWKPLGQTENDLLVQMVNAQWQLRRIEAIESGILDSEMFLNKTDFDQCYTVTTPTMRQADVVIALTAQNSTLLDYVQKSHTRLSRAYDRALKNLVKLQSFRTGEPPQLAVPPPLEEIGTDDPTNTLPNIESNCETPEVFAWLSCFIPTANRPTNNRASWIDAQDADEFSQPDQL